MSASAAAPKRVLLIHSFGNAVPQSRAVTLAFETQLVEKMGGQVDLDQVSLDMARYADRDSQEAIVDYLQKRQAKWRPDIVVTMAAPAAIFAATYRDRLFPEIPIVYASLDRNLLPPGALEKNAVYIGQEFNIPGWIEDMVQIAPATKNIEVVVGATPLERKWQEAFQKAAEPFAARIKFTYYNDLPFAQVLERVAKLPPDSYIFLLLFLRDASGVARTTDEALQRLHEVANAPINSVFSHQLGQGIVGGRLYQSDRIGKEAADVTLRVLHGEPTSNFTPVQIDPSPPHYDWRELRRWKIDEKLLPPGSTVVFRAPTLWEEHRALILGGITLFVVQGLLIAGLVINLIRRRRAEHSLSESEQRITLAAEAAHLGVWELDPATGQVWLSDKARELFDFAPGAPITYTDLQERVHPDDRAARDAAARQAIDTQGGFTAEYRVVRPDGAVRWMSGRGHCMPESNGKSCRLLAVSIDVTERKHNEQLFQLAAEGSYLGVWDWDETSGELLGDGAMRSMFDIPAEARITLELFYSRIYSHDLELVKKVWRGAVESGQAYELDHRVQRRDGSILWVHARGRGYYDDKGKPLRMIGVVFDITERKLAEEEARRRRDQVNSLSRVSLLGEMTASLAHELNQPLSAIVTNATAALQYIARGKLEPQELHDILTDVAADGRRAHDIIQNVRNAIKTGSAIRGRLNLNDVVKAVVHMVSPDAAAQFCRLEMSLAPELPAVEGDPTQIQQVLLNLVRNAFEAMREIPPTLRNVEVSTSCNGDNTICVGVRDHGPGISEATRERLFEQFFTTKEEGLGMGLSIVRSIVEAHGGVIAAENAEAGGARFYFHLPMIKKTPA
jgi:PAS domain S-box-containing protein